MGAVLATAFDQVSSELVKGKRSEIAVSMRLEWLNQWLLALNTNLARFKKNPYGFLEDWVWQMLRILSVSDLAFTKSQCQIIATHFPVYAESWEGDYKCI